MIVPTEITARTVKTGEVTRRISTIIGKANQKKPA